MDSHNGKVTILGSIREFKSISIADKQGRDLSEMAMSIVLHDDARTISWLIIVDNNHICSKLLSIDDFFGELARPSFDQQNIMRGRVIVIETFFSCDITQFRVIW